MAQAVEVSGDLDYGEGDVCFRWDDDLYGYDLLAIDFDGHCSRRMPIHSGEGPPEFVSLSRDRLILRFESALARKLKLDEDVEIRFSLQDAEFEKLAAVVARFNGAD
ncbi:MAG TPA: hypothetical protein VG125_15000 [Pirellulales bacterium]|nr:hypothetical protein [Pirellulales bacterium]